MNETTIKQSFRMLEAGCPEVRLRMDGHKIIAEQMPLGRLWDTAHNLGLEYEFPTDLTSNELVEALVRAIEDYYRNQ